MYVIGTAGHVDHGKSTLVKALTGIDPDRLKEEKDRAMTIDLGFAWLQLPNGEEISVVDVPGHERFVKNMLAGVGGIDLAMLIVAGDEGVMPQTREHLAILDLLHVKRALVVITKKDLVDEDFLELVSGDVEEMMADTELNGAPVLATSSTTGEGLADLKQKLVEMLEETPPRKDIGTPRLPIDRVFIMPGFGTVVTGTLIDGNLKVGQDVEIVPKTLRARIRGLQSHRKKLAVASPGRRLAVNLSGVSQEQLHRGDVVANPGLLSTSNAMDGRMRMVKETEAVLKHNGTVTFHTGTFESPARVRILDSDHLKQGESGWIQIKTQWAAPVVKRDLFILRDSRGTLGGGEIVEPKAKRHRRFQDSLLAHLEVLQAGTPEEIILEALNSKAPLQAVALTGVTNLSWQDVSTALDSLVAKGQVISLDESKIQQRSTLYTSTGFASMTANLERTLTDFHDRSPLRSGMVKEEIRSRLSLPAQAFALVVKRLAESDLIVDDGPVIRLATHAVVLDTDAQKKADRYLAALASNPYSPPNDTPIDPELLNHLLITGKVVRASADVIFTSDAYRDMVDKVKARIHEQGAITVADVRDMFGSSRKYVLALLEHLDQSRITRRVGDERVLR